jgi:hypothetical protein
VLSTSQRRILDELGVDLWVRRNLALSNAPVEETSMLEPDNGLPAPEPGAAPMAPAEPETFTLDLLGFRSGPVLVIGTLPLAEDRRLARDVLAAACGGSVDDAAQAPFKWPQSSRGARDAAAAATALDAFLRGQVERAAVRVIVVLGRTVRALLFPEVEDETCVDFAGARCALTASAEELRASGQCKRRLWHTLLTIPPTA